MTTDSRTNPKLLWGISASIICVVAVSIIVFFWLSNSDEGPHDALIEPSNTIVNAPQSVPAIEETAVSQPTVTSTPLVKEDILSQPVTENSSLAKEELAKLADLQNQLLEQEQALKAQSQDADELIRLKEEQIKILEAQLAQSK